MRNKKFPSDQMRETFETPASLENERKAISEACEKWKCSPVKLPIKYGWDFMLLRDKKIVACCEVRCRLKMYDTYMLSLHKWKDGLELKEIIWIPFILLVQYPEGLFYCDIRSNTPHSFGMGGMNEPRDWQDQEPMVFIPMTEFKKL